MLGPEHDAGRRARSLRAHRAHGHQDGGPGRWRRPAATYIGVGGAGHYVKMVHNGIEYADMQLITEAYDLFKTVYGLDAAAIADIFEGNGRPSDLDSATSSTSPPTVLKQAPTPRTGKRRWSTAIVDEAEQKGTGRWTAAQRARPRRAADRPSPKRSSPGALSGQSQAARSKPRSCCPFAYAAGDAQPSAGRHRQPCATPSTPRRSSPMRRASSR